MSVWQSDGAGGATKVSSGVDEGSQSALNAPDANTIFVSRPDFQALTVDGTVTNQDDLDQKAQAIAPDYLANAAAPVTQMSGVGFISQDLNGLISKIEFTQRLPQTTFFLNHWFRPHTKHGRHWHHRQHLQHGTHGESYPRQHEQHQKRAAVGFSGSGPPMLPSGASTDDAPEGTIFICKVTKDGGSDGTGTTQCSYTYTMTTPDGSTQIATQQTPDKQRTSIGSYLAGGSYGTYMMKGQPGKRKPYLLDAGEVPNRQLCGT